MQIELLVINFEIIFVPVIALHTQINVISEKLLPSVFSQSNETLQTYICDLLPQYLEQAIEVSRGIEMYQRSILRFCCFCNPLFVIHPFSSESWFVQISKGFV